MAEEKIESITIMKAEDLPADVRKEENISSGFVEVRVTRNSPPETKINKLSKSPLKVIRESFKKEDCLGINLKG